MSYPKVIFGPFSTHMPGGHYLRVEVHTNGDWRGTAEGRQELERVESRMINSLDKLPKGSAVQNENPDWFYIKVPCEKREVYRWMEELKRLIPAQTGAVYNEINVQPRR